MEAANDSPVHAHPVSATGERSADDVSRAQGGDVSAFERLYRSHVGRVFALCLHMTRNHSTAEDLTQEIFVRTWDALPSFRGESAFSTWLHRLAVNHVLGSIRSKTRRDKRVTAFEDPEASGTTVRSENHETRMDIETALESLPEGARLVLVLHDIQGFRHDEIASMLGVTSGTSKSQLHRARQLLRTALGDDNHDV